MSEASPDPRFLEIFPAWLRSLGEDVGALAEVAGGAHPEPVRKYVTAALNYLFKSLDLIPDGIDDLGFLDDAFVLRVAAELAVAEVPAAKSGIVERLSNEAGAVREFLAEDYARLEHYVRGLRKGAARGRTVDEIQSDDGIRAQFLGEVKAWCEGYRVPGFTRDTKTLIKLRSFLKAKLA
jgi:uncharacterized membrane protein YkvA (DUF1232 family)